MANEDPPAPAAALDLDSRSRDVAKRELVNIVLIVNTNNRTTIEWTLSGHDARIKANIRDKAVNGAVRTRTRAIYQ